MQTGFDKIFHVNDISLCNAELCNICYLECRNWKHFDDNALEAHLIDVYNLAVRINRHGRGKFQRLSVYLVHE